MTRLTTVRNGASPLYATYGASGRYFNPSRGIMLCEAMKRHCIKFGVFIENNMQKTIQFNALTAA